MDEKLAHEQFEVETLHDYEVEMTASAVCTCTGGCCNNSNNTTVEN